MNHEFMSNPNNAEKCIECGYPEQVHGDNATCECCDKRGNLQIFGDTKTGRMMLLTRECMEREKALMEKEVQIAEELRASNVQRYGVPANGEDRVLQMNALTRPYDKLLGEVRKINEQLHLSSDIFTAQTVPIEDVRKAIWADESIPNDKKFFEFVAYAKKQINNYQAIIFDLDKAKIEAYSIQKSWHIAMNDFANKLRADERQQLKIQDITYDVKMPKPITPKSIKIANSKTTKQELRAAVNELNSELVGSGKEGIGEFTVTMIMTSKNWTLEQAINHLRRTLKEGMSEMRKS